MDNLKITAWKCGWGYEKGNLENSAEVNWPPLKDKGSVWRKPASETCSGDVGWMNANSGFLFLPCRNITEFVNYTGFTVFLRKSCSASSSAFLAFCASRGFA